MLTLSQAETYDEWKAAATELDDLEDNDSWKDAEDSEEYDVLHVKACQKDLDDARLSCDVTRMLYQLRGGLARNIGNMGDLRLYRHSHTGTKKVIEDYIDSVVKTFSALLEVADKQGDKCPLSLEDISRQLAYIRQYFGRSALLLSGGGTFGMNHIGVVKSLWDQNLLPRIISGASAGSIVSAVLCSRTDEEIPEVLHEFCNGELDVFTKEGEPGSLWTTVKRFLTNEGLYDISHLERVMKGLLGETTFQQAYNRTQRILNIPVSPASHHDQPMLLNFVTAPNVMIWSAVCTSCSVPGVFKKAVLQQKNPHTHQIIPWHDGLDSTYIDGSVDADLPMTRMSEMWNVNHFIVSQVNPHVVPFLAQEEGKAPEEQSLLPSATSGWMSTGLMLARDELNYRLQMMIDAGLLPNILTKARSILSQQYSGDINIFPKISMIDFPVILSNPTPAYMEKCMLTGQRATWPRVARVENHTRIELAIDRTLHEFKARLHFLDTTSETLTRPSSHGNDLSKSQLARSADKLTRFTSRTAPSSPILSRSAPTSPFLEHSLMMTPSRSKAQPTPKKSIPAHLGAPTICPTSPSTNAEESSDRDYDADPDSDTTDVLSSPSPLTSPFASGVTLWRAATPVPLLTLPPPRSPPTSPPALNLAQNVAASTSSDRHHGKLLNLQMTSATSGTPSSPERRYKTMFHPAGSVQPETNSGPKEQASRSTTHSRRGSLLEDGISPSLDFSGTRRLMWRKSSTNLSAIAREGASR